jgi:4-amino-4-deoxy-L-arabinose transferase-like glycosyltransferase
MLQGRKPWQSPLLLIVLLALVLRLWSIADHSLWYDEAFAVLFAEKGLDAMLYGTLTPVDGGAADIHPLLYYSTLHIWMAFFGQTALAVRLWSALLGTACVYVAYHLSKSLFSQRTGLAAALLVAIMPYHIHYSQETRMYTLLALLLMLATWAFVKGCQSLVPSPQSLDNNSSASQQSAVQQVSSSAVQQVSSSAVQQVSSSASQQFSSSASQPVSNAAMQSHRRVGSASSMTKDFGLWTLNFGLWTKDFGLRTKSLKYWLLFGVCAGLAMYTQQLAAFYLIAIGLVPFITRRRYQLIGMTIGTITALLIYLPWLVNIPSQLQKVGAYYWVTQPGIDKPLVTIYLFLTTNAEIQPPLLFIAFMGAVFLLLMALIQVVIYARKPRRTTASDMPNVLLVLWLFAAPIALMWLVSQIQPVYLDRGLIASAGMLSVFLGWFFTRSGLPRLIRQFMLGVLLLLVAIGLREQYQLGTFPYSPVADLLVLVREKWQTGDVVVHQNKLSMLPGIYHDRSLPQHFIGDIPGSANDTLALPTQQALGIRADTCLQTASREAGRVWFVVYERAEREAAAARIPFLQAQFDWLAAHYTFIEKTTFNDVHLYLYANPLPDIQYECPVLK